MLSTLYFTNILSQNIFWPWNIFPRTFLFPRWTSACICLQLWYWPAAAGQSWAGGNEDLHIQLWPSGIFYARPGDGGSGAVATGQCGYYHTEQEDSGHKWDWVGWRMSPAMATHSYSLQEKTGANTDNLEKWLCLFIPSTTHSFLKFRAK